ncbi:hypothetical protein N7468_001690 [Penicillium chermesinum]|uniref:Uncharacterized protein n=1 Tax=Penicillium chermesinum TaxID=63820 RepID=A0A9W9PID1_9EURO|nr:uncharacterized protein N7468_001690 [Penicillium chermesinum]KAJ5246707.1 hypothetical protein N7468_001690 [Penicillium chermesinum]KAJ6144978.1 hypothetical protein N7470_008873 [Penicillium chermesinum]
MTDRKISLEELSQHQEAEDAWMAINSVVWNVTGFAGIHPGGPDIILEYIGRDGSDQYNSVHSSGLAARNFETSQRIGVLDAPTKSNTDADRDNRNPKLDRELPGLDEIINLHDLEDAAEKSLNERSWAYLSGATDGSITKNRNCSIFEEVYLRPRVARPVGSADTRVKILGDEYDVPIFNAPASLMMLAHPDAEIALAKGLAASGSTIVIPTLASYSTDEIVEALPKGHPFFFQLYTSPDKSVLDKIIDTVVRLQPRAIFVTVDLPDFGKREANERYERKVAKQKKDSSKTKQKSNQARSAGVAIDSDLSWSKIQWLRERTNLPIFVKGIQCAEDALQAWKIGCQGIYISNHGGRAADTAQPTLLTLAEIRLRYPELLEQMDVFIDGGVRRGTDVLKAICLGAKGVCLGRPFFYALMYGQDGVQYAMQILKDELVTAMKLCGVARLSEAHPGLLNTRALLNQVDYGTEFRSKL